MLRIIFIIFFFLAFYRHSLALDLDFDFNSKNRDHIQIVGSSTLYPFVATIAEEFGRNNSIKTPIVEATGTGGGFKLFCLGIGYKYPDFSNASRKIEKSEIEKCNQNGIKNIIEIKIGYDGIVLANSTIGTKFNLTKKQIFLALAEKIPSKDGKKLVNNFYKKWNEIDPTLPKTKITIYGPPSTSGTRDAFVELAMEDICIKMKEFTFFYPNLKIRQKKCKIIRSDGVFIEAGENDNLIVQKLKNDDNAFGIFGFSFLEENRQTIQPIKINNIEPNFENIASGSYPISRPLFIYFKKEHLNLVPNIKEFIDEIISTDTLGKDGYLMQKGLIPLDDSELKKTRELTSIQLKNAL